MRRCSNRCLPTTAPSPARYRYDRSAPEKGPAGCLPASRPPRSRLYRGVQVGQNAANPWRQRCRDAPSIPPLEEAQQPLVRNLDIPDCNTMMTRDSVCLAFGGGGYGGSSESGSLSATDPPAIARARVARGRPVGHHDLADAETRPVDRRPPGMDRLRPADGPRGAGGGPGAGGGDPAARLRRAAAAAGVRGRTAVPARR